MPRSNTITSAINPLIVSPYNPTSAFSGIVAVHSICGLSYFGYYDNPLIKIATFLVNIAFVVAVILVYSPCLMSCTFNLHTLFKNGFNTHVVSFVLMCLYVYQALMNDLLIMIRGSQIRKFFNRSHDYCKNFGVTFLDSQVRKLKSTTALIIFLNIFHVIGQGCVLGFMVPEKIAYKYTQTSNGNETIIDLSSNETNTSEASTNKPLINVDYNVFFVISLVTRLMVCMHSKAIETIYVFFAQFLSLLLTRLEMRYDNFIYSSKGGRSIEVAKVAFIEVQNLIQEADGVFGHTFFDTHLINIMILIGNLFVVANGIWHETKIEHDVYFSLYNAVISFFSLLLCCSYADEIEEEMDEVIEAIAYINGEAFTDADFRSYSLLVTVSQGTVITGMTAGRFFSLNKRLFFLVLFSSIFYVMLLVRQGVCG